MKYENLSTIRTVGTYSHITVILYSQELSFNILVIILSYEPT